MATKTYSYKNITDQELSVPGVGMVKPGEVMTSTWEIYNANLEPVDGGDTSEEIKINDSRKEK